MFQFMDDTWRERLAKAIEARGVSKRSLSLKAGMGPGYVHSLLSEGKEPTIEKLVRICAELDVPNLYSNPSLSLSSAGYLP